MCVRMCVLVLNQMFFHQNFFNYIFFYVCVGRQGSVGSQGPGDGTQVIGLGGKHIYSGSHLPALGFLAK